MADKNNSSLLDRNIPLEERVPLKEKILFGAADLYGGGGQALVTAIYLVFLTVNGLSVEAASILVLIARFWDAITDPLMGVISDNTRSKYGRRKPYIFIGGFLVIVALGLLLMPLYNLNSQALKFTIYLFSYLLYNTLSTVINVPYSSLSTEISPNYYEKTNINTIRLLFSMVSGGISAALPMILLENLGEEMPVATFSIIVTLVFGLFYGIPLVLCGYYSKERAPYIDVKKEFKLEVFLKPLKLKAFLLLLGLYLCAYSCMDLIAANVLFFAKYGLDFPFSSFFILAIIMVSYALMVPVLSKMLNNGKAKPYLFRVGIPLYIIGIMALCLYPNNWTVWPIFGICVLIGVGMSGCQMMPWIIFPDVVDVGTLKFNERITGSFSGIMTFIKKSTSAVAIGISGIVLGATGFVEPKADANGIVPDIIQSTLAQWGLRLVIMVPVIIFITLAYIFSKKLKLTPERSDFISELLKLQVEGLLNEENLTAEQWAEYEAIQRELF